MADRVGPGAERNPAVREVVILLNGAVQFADRRRQVSGREAREIVAKQVGRNGDGDFAGCGPLDPASQQQLELPALEVRVIFVQPGVAEHGGVDPSAAIFADPVERLVFVDILRPRVGQNGEPFRRTVLAVGQLLGGLDPVGGHAARDGVVAVEEAQLEIVSRTVARIAALPGRQPYDLPAGADDQARAELAGPPAEADHVVILRPFQKGVVGGMKDDEAAAGTDIAQQIGFDLGGPAEAIFLFAAVPVEQDRLVVREARPPLRPRFGRSVTRRAGRDIHLKTPGGLEDGTHFARRGFPVVIIDAIDDQDRELRLGEAGRSEQKESEEPPHGRDCIRPSERPYHGQGSDVPPYFFGGLIMM